MSTLIFLRILARSNLLAKETVLIIQQIKEIYKVSDDDLYILSQIIICHALFPHQCKRKYLSSIIHILDREHGEIYQQQTKGTVVEPGLNKKIDKETFNFLNQWDKKLKQKNLLKDFMKNYPFVLSTGVNIKKTQSLFVLTDKFIFSWGNWRLKNRLKKWVTIKMNSNVSLTPSLINNYQIIPFGNIDLSEEQTKAVTHSLSNPLTIITGGPGTGKTTIIQTILKHFCSKKEIQKKKNVAALVAPTGKAVNRMCESIPPQINDFFESFTIHRILGLNQNRNRPLFDKDKPLNHDLIILDECSMVNLRLMVWLLEATLPSCHLVLMGDLKQLSSIDGSSPFHEMVNLVRNKPDIHIHLTKIHRFNKEIETLVKQIEKKPIKEIFQSNYSNIKIIDPSSIVNEQGLIDQFRDKIRVKKFSITPEHLFQRCNDLDKIFETLHEFAFLTSTKMGFLGSSKINDLFHRLFSEKKTYYPGQPIMILENNYDSELFNGDRGVIVEINDDNFENNLGVVFKQNEKESPYRLLSIGQLPKHETSYAMTIHKSQGSEFKEVVLCLSEVGRLHLSRELFYTGVTRAKEKITIVVNEEILSKTIRHSIYN